MYSLITYLLKEETVMQLQF